VDEVVAAVAPLPPTERAAAAFRCAAELCDEDVASCAAIGEYGKQILAELAKQNPDRPINVLTHCNAGWLATVDYGTALAPVYKAHDSGIPIHVWVDETRPRSQGASLTAWELGQHGVPHTVIADNAGGHLMQHGRVDVCIVGSDRTTASGDVCNKIGTYLKALAAHDCSVPFYAALPGSTIDWEISDGLAQIPIEERSADEVRWVRGRTQAGERVAVNVLPEGSAAANPAFDVTPARLVTGIITERGVCPATADGLRRLYPDAAPPEA
jgi:methylthioribose-1-phosphate isomerase